MFLHLMNDELLIPFIVYACTITVIRLMQGKVASFPGLLHYPVILSLATKSAHYFSSKFNRIHIERGF